jgi:hypothetical protein
VDGFPKEVRKRLTASNLNASIAKLGPLTVGTSGSFVGINTTSPESALHVIGPRAGSGSKGIHMGEGGTNDFAMEIVAGNTSSNSYIDFSTPSVDYNARIIYNHSIKELSIINNGNDIIFSSSGN